MKITQPLDNILDNEAKVKILRFLCTTNAQWNGRQIAREVGISPATAHKALNGLQGEGVLLLRNVGKTHVYSIIADNFIVTDLLKPLFMKERGILSTIITAVRRAILSSGSGMKEDIISIALFGSVDIREDHAMSDVDIAVIVENTKAKIAAEKLFERISEKIFKRFGNNLAPYINTIVEFKTKYNKKMAVVRNLLKRHSMIYGEKLEAII